MVATDLLESEGKQFNGISQETAEGLARAWKDFIEVESKRALQCWEEIKDTAVVHRVTLPDVDGFLWLLLQGH